MKKKIILIVFASFMIMSVVSAASLWGTYKGNQIIRLTVDHKPINVSDVPAISYNGRTMVPIYLLKEAGISYSWDAKNQTVNLVSHNGKETILGNNTKASAFNPTERTNEIMALGGTGVSIMNISGSSTAMVFFNAKSDINGDWDAIYKILTLLIDFDSQYSRVVYGFNGQDNTIEVLTSKLVDYQKGKITEEQFINSLTTAGPVFSEIGNSRQANSSNNTNSNNSNLPVVVTAPELFSNDGKTYLGKITSNTFDSDSIFNEFGTYGSKFQSKSIWNEFGDYGSEFSNKSAFNEFATKPPLVVLDGKTIGYLTINDKVKNAISPIGLLTWAKNNGY
ncbi:stalk domain-containing protein [Cohnella cellulosilytica]